MTIVLIDYDAGNLHSAEKAFQRMAAEVGAGDLIVTADPDVVARADRIVLPGDGAFPACRTGLKAIDGLEDALLEAVEQRATPFLGICVGMQMMARLGLEYEEVAGFGWIGGEVRLIEPPDPVIPGDPSIKVPHMGWNDVTVCAPHPVVEAGEAYFLHSYHFVADDAGDVAAQTSHGTPLVAAVAKGNILGVQFHPEKSQAYGLATLTRFLDWKP